jgi:exodeoxyribonuclease VII small subunit
VVANFWAVAAYLQAYPVTAACIFSAFLLLPSGAGGGIFRARLLFVATGRISNFGERCEVTMSSKQDAPNVSTLTFEAALKELEAIVARLEQGQVDLEDSIVLYERGQALKAHCESKLKAAESRLEKIVQNAGQVGTEPVEIG